MSIGRTYCTYFDSAYLARGLAMLHSLRRQDPGARVFALALDELTALVLRARFDDSVIVTETGLLLTAVPALADARSRRSPWAYYATQKPVVVQFAMESHPRPDAVVFIDADTWFFSDPTPWFEEVREASIALAPNRFPPKLKWLERFGFYCAGVIYWRNDAMGNRCLADWRDDCLDWCDEQPQPDGRFMNQGYLNRWPERYPGVHLIQHPGVNLAPWNIDGHTIGRDACGVTVDGLPLVFYHFHGLERHTDGHWFSRFPHLDRQLEIARDHIYLPYLAAVEAERRALLDEFGVQGTGSVRAPWDTPPILQFDPL